MMKYPNPTFQLITFFFILTLMQCSTPKPEIRDPLEQMAIKVIRSENRPVSFTNKEAAYYYTQSHVNDHSEHAWFEGLTVAQQKIFNGYELYQNGKKLDWEKSELEVYPHKSVRKYENGIEEEFWMFDWVNVLEVGLQKIEGYLASADVFRQRTR